MRLKNKVGLVTGAAQGLGKVIATTFAKEGARVAICDIQKDRVIQAGKDIEGLGAECLAVPCDVSSSESVANMFEQVVKRFGTLHILVNNAALVPSRPVDDERRNRFYALLTKPIPRQGLHITSSLTDEEWLRWFGVNVHGVFYCTREALKIMEPQKEGKIINIGSIAGHTGLSAHSPPYCATKGAVFAFTRSVASEVAGDNIYVNAIACGGVETEAVKEFVKANPEGYASLMQMIAVGRLGKPEDYASLAVYLASDEHYFVGQILCPDGGMMYHM